MVNTGELWALEIYDHEEFWQLVGYEVTPYPESAMSLYTRFREQYPKKAGEKLRLVCYKMVSAMEVESE